MSKNKEKNMVLTNEQIEHGFKGTIQSLLEMTKDCRSRSTTIAAGLGEHYQMIHNSSIDKRKKEEYSHEYGRTLAEAGRNLRACGLKQ